MRLAVRRSVTSACVMPISRALTPKTVTAPHRGSAQYLAARGGRGGRSRSGKAAVHSSSE
eukprot:CAMPEP_0175767844 /NCGR_PEP_ID=MMETSP0097-20121207/70123_1 /TAXON_ID=311494 /ORGANISM="Alexandrium monilatum, Strain CCMP3105" /LENGTH=59 /DNA_ID=CAMNT_0017077939 /DNA_START=38 /DNA_END=214 /DNA_ORIENTATION=-